jgi:superfamily II DNA or RNA helicase
MKLRPYQHAAIAGVREAFRAGKRRVLLVAPTGAGKTVMFSYLSGSLLRNGHNVLLMAHRDELLDQISRTLQQFDVPHGFIAARRQLMLRHKVQVAGVHTLKNRCATLRWKPDWIICDEAHHATAGSWATIIKAYPGAKIIGVTATPCRLDGRGLGNVFDEMVIGPQVADLIRDGYLSRIKYFCPATVDTSGLKKRMGDFRANEINDAVNIPRVTGEAVEYYRKLCDGQPAVAFCASIKHSEHVAETFRAAGYCWQSLDSRMTPEARRDAVIGLGNGSLHGISSCDIISEGFDLPIVSAAILLRPTASLSLFLQQVGRVLRIAPGKTHATIIDHVGNVGSMRAGEWVERHGFAEDVREWSLEGRVKRAKGASVSLCENCFAIMPIGARECSECGWQRPEKQARFDESTSDVELKQVDVERAKAALNRSIKSARSLEDLQKIARKQGYAQGWAWHRWNARTKKQTTYKIK